MTRMTIITLVAAAALSCSAMEDATESVAAFEETERSVKLEVAAGEFGEPADE